MITQEELAVTNSEAVSKLLDRGEEWLSNIQYGVTSGSVEKKAVESFLYAFALGQHDINNPILTEDQIRHIHSRLREI